MNLFELFIIAIGLSMDAFAVAVCAGLSFKKVRLKNALIVGAYFGFFQALMPFLGFILASRFADKITFIDHWLAFALLSIIGFKMIMESLKISTPCADRKCPKSGTCADRACPPLEEMSLSVKKMLPLSLATSIDAMAAGVSFGLVAVRIVPAVAFIGAVTLILSAVGVYVGRLFGAKLKSKAELLGGIILIVMGLKILIEHLFF